MARDRAARPEAKPLRLFIAVDLSEEARSALLAKAAPFRDRIPGARWTRPDGWHVTLKFLGSTWPRLMDAVGEAVERAAGEASAFDSRLTELGVFPGPGRARVVWAGLEDRQGRLAGLAGRLDDLLEEDFVREKRAFTPHLTLARLNPPRDIREFSPELPGTPVSSGPFRVDRLVLYRSHLSPAGATYEPLLASPFGS